MKTYVVKFKNSARKELNKLPVNIARPILVAIDTQSKSPRSGNAKKMAGSANWRLRVGNYRVIYSILDKELVIEIIRIRHRRDVYR